MLKSRKKILLSSIAMLLVALVALGSATFAWFTTNRNVTSSGFGGKAASAIGLKILSESQAGQDNLSVTKIGDYKNSTVIAKGQDSKVLSPVSMKPQASGFNAFTTTAAKEDEYDRALASAVDPVTAPTAYNDTSNDAFYVEKIYVALSGNTGASVSKNVNITTLSAVWGNDDIAKGARIVLQYHNASGDTLVGQYASVANTQTNEFVKTVAANTALAASDTESVTYTAIAPPTGTNNVFSVSDVAGVCYFTISVFLDGQDSNVTTSKIRAADVVSNIQLNLSLAAGE